jgi:CBS domain-containing protein
VVDGQHLAGMVALSDLQRVPRERWNVTSVEEVMTPRRELVMVPPSEDAYVALRKLGQHDLAQLPVVQGDRLVGLLRRSDVTRWLALQTPSRVRPRPRRPRPEDRAPPTINP